MYHRHGAIKMIATMVAMELMVIVTTNIQKMVAESLVESLVVTVATAERPMTVMQKHSNKSCTSVLTWSQRGRLPRCIVIQTFKTSSF